MAIRIEKEYGFALTLVLPLQSVFAIDNCDGDKPIFITKILVL